MRIPEKKDIIKLVVVMVITAVIMTAFSIPILTISSLGGVFFPGDGFWKIPGEVPRYGSEEIPGLLDEVIIIRDEWGVPHIYGENELDVYFAMGYCHAQDRLFQMDMFRRFARGRLAEILGESFLGEDKLHLASGMEYWANISIQKVREMQASGEIDFIPIIERYLDGINHYISTHRDSKPLEYYLLNFEPSEFTLLDMMSILKFMSFYYSWGYEDLYRLINFNAFNAINASWYPELYPKYRPYQIPVCPNYGSFLKISASSMSAPQIESKLIYTVSDFLNKVEQIDSQKELIESQFSRGSNNWVVDGMLSSTGAPILCNDQHWGWPLPQFLYETHLISSDKDLNFFGYTVPGLTFPIVGYNQYLGWGSTIFVADQLDWYYFDILDNDHYIYNGSSLEYTTRNYQIKVRGRAPVEFMVKDTVHGPVMNDILSSGTIPDSLEDPDIILTAKWVPNQVTYEWLAVYKMINSKNRAEFDNGSNYWDMPPINFVYGDIYGNIAIRPTGKVPIRDDSKIPSWYYGNGSLPYNGSNGEGDWIGYVPFDELPNSVNPAQHYLASSNQIAAGPEYTDYFLQNDCAEGYRARRVNYVLNNSAPGSIDISFMTALLSDVNSTMGLAFTPHIIKAIEDHYGLNPTGQIGNVLTLLKNWDYVMDKDLAAPTIYRKWRDYFREFTFDDEFETYSAIGNPRWSILEYFMKEKENSHWFNNINTPLINESRDDIILLALNSTIEWLENFYGTADPSNWRWGDIHKYYFTSITYLDALSKGPYDGDGEGYTVHPSGANIRDGVGYSGGGAAHRIIIDFSNLSNSRTVIAGGQRGLSNSKHYADQLEQLFLQGKLHYTYSGYTTSTFPSKIIESIIYLNPMGG
ncbi:MAG: penicillin acylase family protein [Candidatus Hodarchaeota archaeon]